MLANHFGTVRALAGVALTVFAAISSVPQSGGSRNEYVRIAEGFTSATTREGIRAEYRMFSAPAMQIHCATSKTVKRLRATSGDVRLVVGRLFPLNTLAVVALGPTGEVIRDVAIAVEVQNVSPELLSLQSDRLEFGVLPIRSGTFHFRIRTLCDGPNAETTIKARVVQ